MKNGFRVTGSWPNLKAELQIDGVWTDISNALSGIDLSVGMGELPAVTLHAVIVDLSNEIDDVQAHIPDETRDLLLKLGWTPPGEEPT